MLRLMWYPDAKRTNPEMQTRGAYRNDYPEGAIVHFTAGRHNTTAIDSAIDHGYAYFLITEDGTVYQGAPLNRWGFHAGKSVWPSLGKNVSQYLVGIEITAGGPLKDGKTWFGTTPTRTRAIETPRYPGEAAGVYEAYSPAQEASLIKLLLWLKQNAPAIFSFDNVLGHCEVSPGRKVDPSGALSLSMPELRAYLKERYV